MDFGMPILIENKSLEKNVDLCRELELQFVELNMNLPEYQIEKLENTAYFRAIAEQAGIYFTIHLDENLDIANFNPMISDAYMETVRRTIYIAEKLCVPVLNMHMNHGIHFTLPDYKVQLFEEYFDIYMESFHKFKEICEKQAEGTNIHICIENTNGFREYEKAAIEDMLKSSMFSLTWDIGHSHACKNIDEPFIMKHEDKLYHFHIHDAVGEKDHLICGTGEIDFKQRLSVAKNHNCRCVTETKTVNALRQSVKWLRENINQEIKII
jgi:Xylose isomerase-like TIM barrel.